MGQLFEIRDGAASIGSFWGDEIKHLAADGKLNAGMEIRCLPDGPWASLSTMKGLRFKLPAKSSSIQPTTSDFDALAGNVVSQGVRPAPTAAAATPPPISPLSAPSTPPTPDRKIAADQKPASLETQRDRPSRTVVLFACSAAAITFAVAGGLLFRELSHDRWEAFHSTDCIRRLDEADKLKQADPLAAHRIYEAVIAEASAHQIEDSEFKERLASAAEAKNAIIIERTRKEQEAAQQKIADEKRRQAEAEQQRIAAEERSQAEAEQQRIAAEADELAKRHGKPPSGFAAALQHRDEWLREQPDAIATNFSRWPPLDPDNLRIGEIGEFPSFPVGEMSLAMTAALTELSDKIRKDERIDEFSDELRWWSFSQTEMRVTEYAIARKHNVVLLQKLSSEEGLAYPLDLSNTAESPSLYVPAKAVHKRHSYFLLRGIPVPDESESKKHTTLRLDGPLWVSGTFQYVSNRGADLAVPILQPLDPADLSAWASALRASR